MQKVKIIMTFSFKECNHKYIYKEYRVVSLIRCHFFFPNGLGINVTCFLYLVTQLDKFLSWADIKRNCNTFLYVSQKSLRANAFEIPRGGEWKNLPTTPKYFFSLTSPHIFWFFADPHLHFFVTPPHIFFRGTYFNLFADHPPHIFI